MTDDELKPDELAGLPGAARQWLIDACPPSDDDHSQHAANNRAATHFARGVLALHAEVERLRRPATADDLTAYRALTEFAATSFDRERNAAIVALIAELERYQHAIASIRSEAARVDAERDAFENRLLVAEAERDRLRIDRDSYANSQFERQIDELYVALGKAERERDELRADRTRLLVLLDQTADYMHLSGNEKLAEKLRGKAGLPLATTTTKDDAK